MAAPAAWAQAPDIPPVPALAPAEKLELNHPTVIDTAHLKSGDTGAVLFGVQGLGGELAHSLQSFITVNGDRVSCQPHGAGQFTCMLPTGLDVAATALANGAAKATPDAPAAYREQEAAAQFGRLGIWASLPPAPVVVEHPTVRTTAELVAGGQVFVLDGLIGFNAEFYTRQLQSYIASHADKLTCQERENTGRYVCLLPSGTDIATVALLEGLARASADASPADRAAQARAVADRSGIWFEPPQGDTVAMATPPASPPCCTIEPGDSGIGLAYEEGLPTAIIDDEPVFFFFAGPLGYGFFNRHHHWEPAPPGIAAHLTQFHPNGAGLPGAAHGTVAQASFRPPGFVPPAVLAEPRAFDGANRVISQPGASFRERGLLPPVIGPSEPALRNLPRPGLAQITAAPRLESRPGFRTGIASGGGFRPIAIPPGPVRIAPPPLLGRR